MNSRFHEVPLDDEDHADKPARIYDLAFWWSYLANVWMLTAVSLLFRYSDFVESIGGSEWHLGWIVGLGTSGAIVFRYVQGPAIDRFGAVWIWSASLTGLAVSFIWHLRIDTVNSIEVYAARVLMNTCIAGVFGSWLSFVSLRVRQHQVAEAIGVVGSSGFVGMALGPVIGDWIFQSGDRFENPVNQMFLTSAGLIGVSLFCALAAGYFDGGAARPVNRLDKNGAQVSVWQLLRRHHPGFLLIVGCVMGLAISLPASFLRPFAQSQGIEHIKVFFLTYNIVAFVSRLAFRKAPDLLGLQTTILIGLLMMMISMLLYLLVDSETGLILPAIAGGLAHSFLFPSVVAGGTSLFPKENRGTATSLILAMYDIGVLVGSPLVGLSLTGARSMNLAEYPIMYCLVSAIILATGILFWSLYDTDRGGQLNPRKITKKPKE